MLAPRQQHSATSCKHGVGCKRFGCSFQHPPEHRGDCRYGAKCHRADCHFLHPPERAPASKSSHVPPQALQQQLAVNAIPREGSRAGVVIEQGLQSGGKEKLEVSQHRRQLLLSCALDVSGSMRGAPNEALLAFYEDLCRNVLSESDLLACCTFSKKVAELHAALPLKKVDVGQDLQQIAANQRGGTALWDGVHWAVETARLGCDTLRERRGVGHEDPIVECLIITDGEDTASKGTKLADLLPTLAHPGMPNFNLVVVGLGKVDQHALKKLCEGKKNAHFLYAKDLDAFKQTLGDVVDRIKIRLTVEKPGSSLAVEWKGSRAAAVRTGALHRVAKNGESDAAKLLASATARSPGLLLLGGPATAMATARLKRPP